MTDAPARFDRTPLWAIVALIVAAIAGYSGYWFWARDAFRAEIERQIAERRDRGDRVDYSSVDYDGFPFRLEATFKSLDADLGGVTVAADEARLYAQPWKPTHLIGEAAGDVRLAWQDVEIRPQVARASLLSKDGRPSRFDADLTNAAVALPDGAAFDAGRLQVHARAAPNANPARDSYDVAASASGVRLGPGLDPIFGPAISELRAVGRLNDAPPFARGFRVPDADSLALVLHENGARLDLAEIVVGWGEVRAKGAGALKLDAKARPEGRLDLRVIGFADAVAALTERGLVRPGAGAPATIAEAIAALPSTPEGVEVPLIFEDGGARLGTFDWGAAP